MLDDKDIFDCDDQYTCLECGSIMELQDDVLVCPNCDHSVDIDSYCEEEEDYEDFYGMSELPDSYWESDDEFPEEFPGEKYEDIYKKE